MKHRFFVLTAILCLPNLTSAQGLNFSDDGYVTIFGGVSPIGSSENDVFNNVGLFLFSSDFGAENGYNVGAVVGLSLSNTTRAEIELSYTENEVNSFNSLGTSISATGDLAGTFLMVNLWYDVPVNSVVTPYFGGGAGIGRIEGSGFGFNPGGTFTPISGSSTDLALQIGAGLRWGLSTGGALDIGYRYRTVGYDGLNFVSGAGTDSFENGTLESHNLNIGYSFSF